MNVRIIENKSEIGAGTRGASLGIDALKMGGIGTVIDVVTPPILRAPAQAAKWATRSGAKILNQPVPKFAQPIERQKSIYPLSAGQKTAQLDGKLPSDKNMNTDLMREEQLRHVPEGEVIVENNNLTTTATFKSPVNISDSSSISDRLNLLFESVSLL